MAGVHLPLAQAPHLSSATCRVLYGAFRYWLKEKDERAVGFKELLFDGINELFKSYGVNDLSMVIDDGEDDFFINPNLSITL